MQTTASLFYPSAGKIVACCPDQCRSLTPNQLAYDYLSEGFYELAHKACLQIRDVLDRDKVLYEAAIHVFKIGKYESMCPFLKDIQGIKAKKQAVNYLSERLGALSLFLWQHEVNALISH